MVGAALALAVVLVPAVILVVLTAQPAQAQTYSVLYSFNGGKRGKWPSAGLILDRKGNLYGTTLHSDAVFTTAGTVFELRATGKQKVLYRFTGKERQPLRIGSPGQFVAGFCRQPLWHNHKAGGAYPPGERCSGWIRPARRPCCTASPAGRMGQFARGGLDKG